MHSVLVVEDDVCIRKALEYELSELPDVRVDCSRTVEKAIQKLGNEQSTPYELILVDLAFPINGILVPDAGFSIIEEMVRFKMASLVIVITQGDYWKDGILQMIEKVDMKSNNVVRYLIFKPWDSQQLKDAIGKCLNREPFEKLYILE